MNIREKFKETGLEELKEEIEVLKQALRECNEKLKGRAGKWN
jgi:peptidoglycan hydrolase CwlO-like protein